MRFLANLLWIVLGGGIFIFFEYLIGGLALCLTVVGIPFGLQCMKLAVLGLAPFGREVREAPRPSGLSALLNVVWILFGGIWLALTHLVLGLFFALTLIGIPFARQHMKLARLSLTPFGAEVV